jgi:hypothetical protein
MKQEARIVISVVRNFLLLHDPKVVAEDESKYYGWIRARIQMACISAGNVMCTVIRLEAQGNNSISAVTMNATYV